MWKNSYIIICLLLINQSVLVTSVFGIHTIISRFNNFVVSLENVTSYKPNNNYGPPVNNALKDEYDFIIVGSGSAGAVIANRLSEVPQWKILLLEAGNRGNILTQIPVVAPLFQLTPYNWNYTMEKQELICLGMVDGICSWPRGRALGGSTVINYMIYTRGNPVDYQKWAEQGNPGWAYKDVLPYYLKSEDCRLGAKCQSPHHNQGGYLSVEPPFSSEITDAFVQAGQELGHNSVDYNSEDFMGFSKIQANLKRGKRHSAAAAFLDPIIHRPNLRIVTSARVTKILINPSTKQAYGVEFIKRKVKFVATATKEVILSAGAFNSPQLLMLSGVGPQEHLEELGIPLIQNLPVGQSLYDHISYLGLAFKINRTVEPRLSILYPQEVLKFLTQGKGIYTSLGGVEALAYIQTAYSQETVDYPDIELIFSGIGSLQSDNGIISVRELRIRRDLYDKVFLPIENTPCWSILPMLLHPKSKGYLKLKSRNPFDHPLLYGNYFTDPEGHDLKTMLAAIRYIQQLAQTDAFQKFGSTLHDTPLPNCQVQEYDSDEYWECALRTLSVTLHHQVATCKMGSKNDPEAVVDERLRVYGVKNLRVADTSVIPVTLSAHTSAPSMMIGEKVSDIIKEDWNL